MHFFLLASLIGDYGLLLLFAPIMAWFAGRGLIRAFSERKRTEKLRQVAGDLQLRFETGGAPAVEAELGRFRRIGDWHAIGVRNVMKGSGQGAEVCVFDFSGKGDTGRTRKYFTALRFRLPGLQLATFTLQPEELLHKFFDAGFGDIDFVEFPAFSEMFLLAGPDEAEVRRLFDRELIGLLESKPGITIEARGEEMLIYRSTKRPEPNAIGAFLSEGLSLFSAFTASRDRTRGALPPPLPGGKN